MTPAKLRYHAWGQNPARPGRSFSDEQEARCWCEKEAPLSDGWAFIEDRRTGILTTYRAATPTSPAKWSDSPTIPNMDPWAGHETYVATARPV
jgi:hypothetical protein